MVDVHKGRRVSVPVVLTLPLLEEVEKIAGERGGDKRSWVVRELLKEALDARKEKGR